MITDRSRLSGTDLDFYPLSSLPETSGLPMTVKVLLEGMLRLSEVGTTNEKSVRALSAWPAKPPSGAELPFLPARVLMQDFTGVPAVVDPAAMRSAMKRAGKDAGKVDPLVPVDLIIDHSVQVDAFGFRDAYTRNIEKEIERNRERYSLLRWAQQAFHNFSLVPPGMGICHQVNLEYVAKVVQIREIKGRKVAIPDTLMGTDSHTTMVNGLGVLGWGVGGIEAEPASRASSSSATRRSKDSSGSMAARRRNSRSCWSWTSRRSSPAWLDPSARRIARLCRACGRASPPPLGTGPTRMPTRCRGCPRRAARSTDAPRRRSRRSPPRSSRTAAASSPRSPAARTPPNLP